VAVLTDLAQLEDRRQPTTTLEGWRRFVDADPPGFTMLPDDLWTAMAEDERVAYDEARIAHHAELVVVTTSAIQEITNEGRMLTLLNQRENGARQGLIVSGEAATGKTTAIKQLGRFHELRTRRRFPGSDRIPVVYVTAPAKGSPRKLAMEFARFLGLPPIPSRANATDIADAVCQILIEARCDLVLIDELHTSTWPPRAARTTPTT
jgi:predicted ATPase